MSTYVFYGLCLSFSLTLCGGSWILTCVSLSSPSAYSCLHTEEGTSQQSALNRSQTYSTASTAQTHTLYCASEGNEYDGCDFT